MNQELEGVLQNAAAQVSDVLNAVFTSLDDIAGHAVTFLRLPRPTRQQLSELEPVVNDVIARHEGVVIGAGLAVAPGTLVDAAAWMQSWHLRGAEVALTRHSLNPDSMSYYDYADMEWFSVPAQSGVPYLTSPYMDFGGTDELIATASMPVEGTSGPVSVVAADLSLARIETLFLKAVGNQSAEIALVTADDRVVATNSARAASEAVLCGPFALVVNVRTARGTTPWRVVVRDR